MMYNNTKYKSVISVIIPVYNVEKYLAECIDSVLRQSYKNIEILLVDDGSTDGSSSICDAYLDKDKRISVIHKLNGGVSSARNVGIDRANGKYIAFVDSDDLLHSRYLEVLYEAINIKEVQIATCASTHEVRGAKLDLMSATEDTRLFHPEDAIINTLYQREISNGPHAKLIESSLLNNERFREDITIAEDLEMNYRLFRKATMIWYSSLPLYIYRQHPGSTLSAPFKPNRLDELRATNIIIKEAQCRKDYKVELAAINRHFAAAMFVAAQITHEAHAEYRNVCIKSVKRYKSDVVKDRESRITYRILALAALLSAWLPIAAIRLKLFCKNIKRRPR